MRTGRRWLAVGAAGTLAACAAMVGAVHTASARDTSGVHDFFLSMGGSAEEAAPTPRTEPLQMAPPSRLIERSVRRSPKVPVRTTIAARVEHPLTVRLHAAKAVKSTHFAAVKPSAVSRPTLAATTSTPNKPKPVKLATAQPDPPGHPSISVATNISLRGTATPPAGDVPVAPWE